MSYTALLVLRMLCKECSESYLNRFSLLMWTGETIQIRFVWTRFSLKRERREREGENQRQLKLEQAAFDKYIYINILNEW